MKNLLYEWGDFMKYKKSSYNEERKEEKRKLIFHTAAKVFIQNGYHKTTVKDIVDKAGVSVGNFYLYFENKEDIFEKIFDAVTAIHSTISNLVIQNGEYSVVQRFCRAITASLWTFERYKELTRIMIIEAVGLNPRLEEKRIAAMNQSHLHMESILRKLQENHQIDIPDPKIGALVLEGASLNVRTFWLLNEINEPLRSYAYALNFFILQGLGLKFTPDDVRNSIDKVLEELDNNREQYAEF